MVTMVSGGTKRVVTGGPPGRGALPVWLDDGMPGYDAFLLVSFGGPEGPGDVMPFLENVTRGRNVPQARLEAVAEHYLAFGGVSPINEQCRELIAALDLPLPVYWGNRNWTPYLTDTVREMTAAGVRRALAFVTSAYRSYSSCRQYLQDIERARAAVGQDAPVIDKIQRFYDHPGFTGPFAAALAEVSPDAHVVFTAHSIPLAMAELAGPGGGRYTAELIRACRLIAEQAGVHRPWSLAYTSRSGPPSQPWLEPDINDHLAVLAKDGVGEVAVVPVGFVSDHMEVIHDLDVEAAATAQSLGLAFTRIATPGVRLAPMIGKLVREHLSGDAPKACPAHCCLELA
jgi:protoporphyrin/coproporphyrin ferrochelatase